LSAEPFTVANGLLTASHKLARFKIIARFAKEIEHMYAQFEEVSSSSSSSAVADASAAAPSSDVAPSSSPSSSSADRLAALMSRVLHLSSERLSASVDVRRLGISSIAAVQLAQTVRREMGVTLPVQRLLDHSAADDAGLSISQLAEMMQPSTNNNEAASHQHAERAALEQQSLIESLRHDLQLTLDPPLLPEAALPSQSLQELYDRHALSPSLQLPAEAPSTSVPASASALPQQVPRRRHVLLTGATGFLGGQTLWHILESDESVIVHCLVRNPSSQRRDNAEEDELRVSTEGAEVLTTAKQRLERSLRSASLWRDEFSSRILVYPSALEEELLGLSPVEYALLSRHVDTIVHAAAEVNWVLPYSAIRASNVVATQQLLRFAAAAAAATSSGEQLQAMRRQVPVQFVHVSTTSAGRGSDMPLLGESAFPSPSNDDDDDAGGAATSLNNAALERVARRYPSGYALSKWCAEWLVLRSGSSGQAPGLQPPSSHVHHHLIVRPGFIGPHATTGHSAPRDFLTRYLATVLHTKRYVASSRRFDFTTVDQVAQQLWAAATEQQQSADVRSDDRSTAAASSSSSFSAPASVPAATTIMSIDSADAPPASFPSYTQLGEAVSRALSASSVAADAASLSRALPSPCSAEEFVAAVSRDTTTPLYPLLHVISAPGYFGLRTGPRRATEGASAAATQEELQQKSMHLVAIERCVQRLLVRGQELK
jgi:thioester reductase-like protein/acyl carrier protein